MNEQHTRQRNISRLALAAGFGVCLSVLALGAQSARSQTLPPTDQGSHLPATWRDIKDGVGGFPAGPMLEIAVRRTHSDKLEMFKWRSEFIAMMNEQPGPLIEREWHAISEQPGITGAGTWTGMTWWENQQRWQDMANMLFPTPIVKNWLATLDMTLVFVKPLDDNFSLSTLAQSGSQVLELGLLVFPTSGAGGASRNGPAAAQAYLDALKRNGAQTYRFAIYPNPSGFIGPYTAAYNKGGPPSTKGEQWYVYMVTYGSEATRNRLQSSNDVRQAFGALSSTLVKQHSDIQVSTRTTSQVCIKKDTNDVSFDPDTCHVGMMGSGDAWAQSSGERPQGCITTDNMYSLVSPKTCEAVGGRRVDASSAPPPKTP